MNLTRSLCAIYLSGISRQKNKPAHSPEKDCFSQIIANNERFALFIVCICDSISNRIYVVSYSAVLEYEDRADKTKYTDFLLYNNPIIQTGRFWLSSLEIAVQSTHIRIFKRMNGMNL